MIAIVACCHSVKLCARAGLSDRNNTAWQTGRAPLNSNFCWIRVVTDGHYYWHIR